MKKQTNQYKDVVKTFLAGIKIAHQLRPLLWRRVVYRDTFWTKITTELEQAVGWNDEDDKMIQAIVAQFKQTTSDLPVERQVEQLEELLQGGWKSAKAHTSMHEKITKLMNRLQLIRRLYNKK